MKKLCDFCQMEKRDGVQIKSCTVNESGRHHSYNDKPAVVYGSGRKEWQFDGEFHRKHGPAVKDPRGKTTEWIINGDMHREDGPAYIFNGEFYYFLDGYEYDSEEEWKKEVDQRKEGRKLRAEQDASTKRWMLVALAVVVVVGVISVSL